MEIRQLTGEFAVSPQIEPSDVSALVAAGFRMVICNRPDAEVSAELFAEKIRVAVEEAGLIWAENVFSSKTMIMEHVVRQGDLAGSADGPVLAYCRTGTRSATAWAFSQAGVLTSDEIVAATERGGYTLKGLREQIEVLAEQRR